MAQAARLNLRMQKELKLLLTDPPPSVSFPTLSNDSSSASSLTSIDALLQGPEGTVYSSGVFKIKIQIPERYPFQPPIVTFATPIYHPNIDNGGRICLDILNLPPKGMWQPSLNISTVLTSIGLLLSEPNPDDGLMHEASRDHKYNRQAFDQNARSMTEKYARAGETESSRGSHGIQTQICQSTGQTKLEGSDASISFTEHRKLSLESLGSCSNVRDSDKIYKLPTHDYSKDHIEFRPLKEANNDLSKYSGNIGKLQATRNKLALKVSVASYGRIHESENTSLPNHCSSLLEIQTTCTNSSESLLSMQVGNIANRDEDHTERSHKVSVSQEQQSLQYVKTSQSRTSDEKLQCKSRSAVSRLDATNPLEGPACSLSISCKKTNACKDTIARKGNFSTNIRPKKQTQSSGPFGFPQNHLIAEKENLAPVQCFAPQLTNQSAASAIISSVVAESDLYCNETGKQAVAAAPRLTEIAAKPPLGPVDQILRSNNSMILHSKDFSSPHSKYLYLTDEKPQINKVCHSETIDKCKQMAEVEGLEASKAVIVLDSEDSEDEIVPMRSKFSLAKRRCLSKKEKSGF